MEPAALAEVQAPAILFWEFNHYVVYDGMGRRLGRRGVYINDPDKGRRFVPMEDFDTSFTGVVLVFEPGDDFRRGGRKPGRPAAPCRPGCAAPRAPCSPRCWPACCWSRSARRCPR